MKRKIVYLLVLLVIPFAYNGCRTDFDVNAPWEDIAVVYGLIDPGAQYQFIRINKAFLGEVNAEEMAQVRDSSEYQNVSGKVVELASDGSTIRSWALRDTAIERDLDPNNVFYNPSDPFRTAYYFKINNPHSITTGQFQDTSWLNPNSRFRLEVSVEEGKKQITAETEVIDGFGNSNLSRPQPGNLIPMNFNDGVDFSEYKIKFTPVKDAKRYNLTMKFHYINHYVDGSRDTMTVPWVFQTMKAVLNADGTSKDGELVIPTNGEDFYRLIEASVPEFDPNGNIARREPIADPVDFEFTIGGEELNTYMEVNEPSTGIIQDKPEYTNITGGIGIFSTRIKKVISRTIGSTQQHKSITELVDGDIGLPLDVHTYNRGFCHPFNPNHLNYCYQ